MLLTMSGTVLAKFGFSSTVINWIKGCVDAPWIGPLVNGRPTGFFKATRGLRQGCLLSPLLYAIQALVLSFQLNLFQEIHSLPGLRIVNGVWSINHAQFVDDTLLLGGASSQSSKYFNEELEIYKDLSGSKINFQKIKIFS